MGILQSSIPLEFPEELRWNYQPVAPCFLRGPFMIGTQWLGFETHHPLKRTVPCYRFLKGCTLDCPRCKYKRQFTVYLPLLDMSAPKRYRIVVTGGKKTWASLCSFKVGDVVGLTKANGPRETLYVKPWPDTHDEHTLRRWRAKIIDDISPYLFHLWQERPLTEHFGLKYYPSLRTIENVTDCPPQCAEPDDYVPH